MIFYYNLAGECIGITAERIFQGSKKVNSLTFVGAVAEKNALTARFEFGENLSTETAIMSFDENFNACNLKDEFGNGYNAWTCTLPATVTLNAGIVDVQFYITGLDGEVMTTAKSTFEVEGGVITDEPEKYDTYEEVLNEIVKIKNQLENAGGGSGSGTNIYRYTINGTFTDHMTSTTMAMRSLTFTHTENVELTSDNLFGMLESALSINGGGVDNILDTDYAGEHSPIAITSGYGTRAILCLNQMNMQVETHIMEEIELQNYTVIQL